jgi:hypothetical protein
MGVGRAASGWLGALVGTMGPWSLRVDLKVTFRLPEFFTTGPSDPILGKAGVASVTQQGLRACFLSQSFGQWFSQASCSCIDPLARVLGQRTNRHLY